MNKSWFGVFLFFLMISTHSVKEVYCLDLDAKFEPTAHEIVTAMIEIARVNENDIVYDLGCGDGRIVIAAAQRGAKGIGIDIDPQRIAESQENARKENVSDKVKFIQQDLFDAHISDASVIMLYLLPSVNLALRPKILKEVLPGTRVVSHSHNMGEWEPDISTKVSSKEPYYYYPHTVFFWVVPANVSGSWEWTVPINNEEKKFEMEVQQKFQRVNGVLTIDNMTILIQDMILTGDRLRFSSECMVNNEFVPVYFEGHVKEHIMSGSVISGNGLLKKNHEWHATRNPSTVRPLDK